MFRSSLIFLVFFHSISVFANKNHDARNYLAVHHRGQCTPQEKTCIYFTPTDLPIEAVRAYLKTARQSIRIATYNMSIPDYAPLLNELAARGVRIEYMVDYKLSYENKLWPHLSGQIEKIRIPTLRGGNPQMHNKLIIIDNSVVLTGSANYSSMGLIANYENVMAITNPRVIQKYNDEINELKATALAVCQNFARGNCYNGQAQYHPQMHYYLTAGRFQNEAIKTSEKRCRALASKSYRSRKALLNGGNQASFANIHECFIDSDFSSGIARLVAQTAQIERFSDGQLVANESRYWQHRHQQNDEKQVYFSPEDNLQDKILAALESTLQNPRQSFAYVSTNFITNRRIAQALIKMQQAGVRMRIFFDKGRFVDPNFSSQIKQLTRLGFFGDENIIGHTLQNLGVRQAYHPSDYRNPITIFHNDLTGPWACNHNKWAVIGNQNGTFLLNGSANWSNGAMRINDENLLITSDQAMVAIYLKEMLGELFIYRYGQDLNHPQLWDDIEFLSQRSPCLRPLMGIGPNNSCQANGEIWHPRQYTSLIANAMGGDGGYTFNIAVPQLNNNRGANIPFYGNKNFAGKWITAFSVPLNWQIDFWGQRIQMPQLALPIIRGPFQMSH